MFLRVRHPIIPRGAGTRDESLRMSVWEARVEADVRGAGTRDEPLRMSAWEANTFSN